MDLSAQTIRQLRPIEPFVERSQSHGMTYGVGPAGYDVRIDVRAMEGVTPGTETSPDFVLMPRGVFTLGCTIEKFRMPANVVADVLNKSTWARRGLHVWPTRIEPGWRGYLTLELENRGRDLIVIEQGMPIAQIAFRMLDHPTDTPYNGRYQDQEARPMPAKLIDG